MRCVFPGCDRPVGLRKYCRAHQVWVEYLRKLKHASCGASCPHRR